MEQIPVNMIERIEVVRGGGSALYGAGAIGGTVNVITKIPQKSGYEAGYTWQNTRGTNDHILAGNATAVTKKGNAGGTFFLNNRRRGLYDHNGDNFSELPMLKNNSFGSTFFLQPSSRQKIEANLAYMNEYRYGGEMVSGPAHLALQSEERTHHVFIGNVDYQLNFNEENSSLIAYAAGQYTHRAHYTGIFPDDSAEVALHLQNPPYGNSDNTTWQAGVQMNHRLKAFPGGSNVLTLGAEYVEDDVLDQIPAYNYQIDQTTRNLGIFLQSDWQIGRRINLLTGMRTDRHNLLDQFVVSPRVALMYKINALQLRATWGRGFRAPQAFDADMHLAFAGGGVSRISLADNLRQERSNSVSASVNYDKATERFIAGFTLEGFHTYLRDAFFLFPTGQDQFGERFEKRNGDGATVQGITLELRGNYRQKVQLEGGFTLQSSLFDRPVENVEGLVPRREFMRTPNRYGYANLSLVPNRKVSATLNLVYTGSMEMVHFGGAPEQLTDVYVTSQPFAEVGFRGSYLFSFPKRGTGLELYGGVKNIFNAYQGDFDTGKNRDSNYIYGPSLPRTVFVGMKIRSLP
jgi:outer membrane receptor for ferrienterochelin and colicins